MLGVRLQIADIRLGVATGAVQQDQRRFGRIAGMQVTGSHTIGVEVTLRERNTLQITPHALVLGHQFLSLPSSGNFVLVFCQLCVLKSHINVHYV